MPVADMAAQLASMGGPALEAAAPQPGPQLPVEADSGHAGPSAASDAVHVGSGDGAEPTATPATAHLHLLSELSRWQSPGTVLEQLRLTYGSPAAAPDSTPAPAQTIAEQVATVFGEVRLALFWVSAGWCLGPASLPCAVNGVFHSSPADNPQLSGLSASLPCRCR